MTVHIEEKMKYYNFNFKWYFYHSRPEKIHTKKPTAIISRLNKSFVSRDV